MDNNLPISDEESDDTTLEDSDTCTPSELEQHFQQSFSVHYEKAISLNKNYVINLAKDDSFTRLAAGLSDGSVHPFIISSERGLSYSSPNSILPPPLNDTGDLSICGVRFMDETPNLLLVGTTNHLVRLFDLRTEGEVGRFSYSEDDAVLASMPQKIVCFDRNSNSRILCVGTEQHQKNVLLLFYDVRNFKQMGCYGDSHEDDVTSICFHPQNPDLMCSGSTDGLINVFDIQKTTEDDALLMTLNTESSVHKVNWHKNVYDKDIISCITHTNDFKLYECDEGDLIAEFERATITDSIKRTTVANCNLIDCHNMMDGELFLLTGSNLHKGEIMRSLLVQNKKLLPYGNFQGNKQIVRESVLDNNSNVLITGGESGIITLWTQSLTNTNICNLKAKKKKTNKTMPY